MLAILLWANLNIISKIENEFSVAFLRNKKMLIPPKVIKV